MIEQNAKNYSGVTPIVRLTTIWKLSAIISFFLLFSLSFQSIPLPIQAQIIPLTSLLAVFFLPFIINRVHLTPLLKMVILFVIFALIHSLVALFIDMTALGAGEIRVLAWTRQVAALIAGLSVFLVLRRTLVSVSNQFIIYAVAAGALPALTVALLNVLWGLTGNAFAGSVVTGIRSTLIPLGFTAASRASGLSLEPSHFAFYLATVVIPITFIAFIILKKRLLWLVLLVFILIAFTWTVSMTGLIVLSSLVLAGVLLGPRRNLFIVATAALLVSVVGFAILFPNNYAIIQIRSLLSGDWSLSIINRFYSTLGPIINSLSSYTLLGYGLGGTSTHFNEIVPEFAQADIAAVSWEGMPNLRSLIGRILAETGLMGLWLFAMIIFVSLQELRSMCRRSTSSSGIPFLKVAKLALFAFLVGSIMDHGSFALPYFWFWLAVIDSRYILKYKGSINE